MKHEIKQYPAGKILGKGFNLYISNIAHLVILAVLFHIPTIVAYVTHMNNPENENILYTLLTGNEGYFFFYSYFITLLVSSLYTYILSKKYLNKPVLTSKFITWTLIHIIPLAVIGIIEIVLCTLGFFAFITPGIMIWMGLSVVQLVYINEKSNIFKSLKRSWVLTRDYKWNLFVFFIFILLLISIIQGLFSLLVTVLPINLDYQDMLTIILSTILYPLTTGVFTIMYFNIRIQKEAFDIEHLTEQFSIIN